MELIRRGAGKPLLLIHGLGGHWRSWAPILEPLAASRELVLFDLPATAAPRPKQTAGRSTASSAASNS